MAEREGGAVVRAEDIAYARRGYRSFEHLTFTVAPGEVHVLVDAAARPARDALLAVAGRVAPTAGRLEVCGSALPRGAFRVRRCVGLGWFAGVNDCPPQQTVAEALSHELALRGRAVPYEQVLDILAAWMLATHADRAVDELDPDACARLGAACAAAPCPQLAVVPALEGAVPPACSVALVRLMRAWAERTGTAFLAATAVPAAARAADAWTPVSIEAAELMEADGRAEASHA